MGKLALIKDGLVNLVANLGTPRDKAAASFYGLPLLSEADATNAYRGTWLARKVIDIPAMDSCRKWRGWSADQALRRILPEQTITADFREASGRLQLGELSLDDSWSGLHLDAIQEATGVRIAFVTRFGEGVLPGPDMSYQQGDVVHAMMRTDDVEAVSRVLSRPPGPDVLDFANSLRRESDDAPGSDDTSRGGS